MTDTEWIMRRLPADSGITEAEVEDTLNDPEGAHGVRELALADLLDVLASQDRYRTVSIGNTSYSDPVLMERAKQWRLRAPVDTVAPQPSTFSFIPIVGRAQPAKYDEYGAGAER